MFLVINSHTVLSNDLIAVNNIRQLSKGCKKCTNLFDFLVVLEYIIFECVLLVKHNLEDLAKLF